LTLIIIADRKEKVKREFKISIDKVLTGGPGKKSGECSRIIAPHVLPKPMGVLAEV